MEPVQILDAVERYLRGEMSPEELAFFKQLRDSSPEVDQLVVEHILFLQQMQELSDRRFFKTQLSEVHHQLEQQGDIQPIAAPQSRVIDMFRKYKKVLAAAAAIAGVIALATSGLVAYFTPKGSVSEIAQLKKEINAVKISQKQTQNEIKGIKNTTVAAPIRKGKFGGTGFLIDPKGYLVTSAHVIAQADSVYVVNAEGDYFKAEVLAANDQTDIAILKIDDRRFEPMKALPYGFKKSGADLGEPIFTLGFPRTDIVYNEGYLSAKTGYNGDTIAYQIAISANPGNSGGPIFNNQGEVIGVLSGKQTTAEGVVFSSRSINIYRAIQDLKAENNSIKLNTGSQVKNLSRVQKIKKMESCIFNVMSY
jgi:S1-C subfamily serine protease